MQYGESTDYSTSTVKQVVDAWKNTAVKSGDSAIARLISLSDLTDNLGYEYYERGTTSGYNKVENTPTWVYNSNYRYWTMSSNVDSSIIWDIYYDGNFGGTAVTNGDMVRPILELNKSAEITKVNS